MCISDNFEKVTIEQWLFARTFSDLAFQMEGKLLPKRCVSLN